MPKHANDRTSASDTPAWMAGGGQTGALMRSLDWDRSPLGAVAGWPASLKTTIGVLLHSRHPMFLWWGPELIQFYNDAYLPSFGVGKHPAAMGQRGHECWPETWSIIGPQIDDVMARGIASWHEDQLVPIFRNDCIEEVYWTYGYSPVIDEHDRVGGTLVVCTETTGRVAAARRLEGLHEERGALLTELEAANRAKDEFLAMLGHELRNPLSPIVTALDLMKLHGVQDHLRERNVIERQVKHLVRLVDDLLDVSKITRGKVELKREVVELAEVLANAVEIASVLLEQRTHALTLDIARDGLLWEGDPVRLAQAVANLLTNAARYTPAGGRIALEARREDDKLVISVADNGSGIPAEVLPRIFDLFVQGPRHADRITGGLGIGLTLAKTLVTMHGGTITAQSDGPGRGSTFVIRLPAPRATLEKVQAKDVAARPIFAAAVTRHRILVVDDNVDAAEVLGEILRESGHDVSIANDPIAALGILERLQPSVALVDIGMPVMDGYELAERMRETASGQHCRLIALTGYGQEHDRARSARAGFAGHFVKPVDLEALLRAVDQPA